MSGKRHDDTLPFGFVYVNLSTLALVAMAKIKKYMIKDNKGSFWKPKKALPLGQSFLWDFFVLVVHVQIPSIHLR